jgi:iron(III) transport system permease protein
LSEETRSLELAWRGWRLPPNWPVTAAAGIVALVSLIPLGFIVIVAIRSGWDDVVRLVVRPRVAELLTNTVWLETLTVPVTIVLAVALGWVTERTQIWGGRVWSAVLVTPLAIPAFVQSYAWNSVLPQLHGLPGVVLIAVISYLPFIYLPVAAQLRRLDPALEDAAASLGRNPRQIFWRVILPQLRLPVCAGALLVGLHLLGEYGLFAMMRYDTFATAIVDQFQSVYDAPAANLLGGVLVLCCLVLFGIEALARGDRRYARLGSGAARAPERHALGKGSIGAIALLVVTVALSLGVALVELGRWLWIGGLPVWVQSELWTSLGATLLLSVAGAALCTLMAMPMAWLSVRGQGRLPRWLESAHLYAGALPGLIIALALVSITVRMMLPLYQTAATLIFAYALMFLPRALTGLRSSMAQAPVELERAAMSLGKSPFSAVWRTTIRLAAPGVAASLALAALGITNELTGTLLLAPNGTRTLATKFWALTSELDYVPAAPYALLMILLALPLTWLLRRQADRALSR